MKGFKLFTVLFFILTSCVAWAYPPKTFQVSLPFNYHAPQVGLMAEQTPFTGAMIRELNHHKMEVLTPNTMARLMRQRKITSFNFLDPKNLVRLRDTPIDAILILEQDAEQQPNQVTATLLSAYTGKTLAQVNADNGTKHRNAHELAHWITQQLLEIALQQSDWGF